MAVSQSTEKLDSEDIGYKKKIKEGWLKKSMRMANAVYEGLFDAKANSATVQAWSGHDHVHSGGPITRGCSWSADGGTSFLFSYTPTSAKQQEKLDFDGYTKDAGIARYYGSPLFSPRTTALSGWICYSATEAKFRITFAETKGAGQLPKILQGAYLDLDVTVAGESASVVWQQLPSIPMSPGIWNQLEIYAENETHDGSNNPTLLVYGIYLTESDTKTKHGRNLQLSHLGAQEQNSNSRAGMAFSAFEALDESLANDKWWMDTDILSRVFWQCNGLFEGTLDQRAPNKTTQTVKGHDHEDYGGLSITRNKVCAIDYGQRDAFKVQVASSGEHGNTTPSTGDATWHLFDRDTAAGGLRSSAGIAHLKGYVSPNINNTGTSTAPYLDAMLYVGASGASSGYTLRLAIYNRDQSAFSTVGTITATGTSLGGWIYLSEIPCSSDGFNEFDIYVQCTSASVTLNLYCGQISESAVVDGSIVSQPQSSGSTTHLGVTP